MFQTEVIENVKTYVLLKPQSYTTHIQVFQVTSFDFVNKPSSKFCFHQEPSSDNLFLHAGLKSPSFTIYRVFHDFRA